MLIMILDKIASSVSFKILFIVLGVYFTYIFIIYPLISHIIKVKANSSSWEPHLRAIWEWDHSVTCNDAIRHK